MSVTVIRHGKTALNHEDPAKERIRGWKDVPLDAEGVKEGLDLAKKLKTKKFFKIYSSDLSRAYRTAQLINRFHDAPIIKTKNLRTWGMGKYEGKLQKEANPELSKFIDEETKVPEGGESFRTFRLRALNQIRQIIAEVKLKKTPILVSTHYRVLQLLKAWEKAGSRDDLSIDAAVMREKGKGTGETLELLIK